VSLELCNCRCKNRTRLNVGNADLYNRTCVNQNGDVKVEGS